MELGVQGHTFIVTGASSGLGRAVAERLLAEEAVIIAVARRQELLDDLAGRFPGRVTAIAGDVRDPELPASLVGLAGRMAVKGAFINAGGPPARSIGETTGEDWDHSYQLLLRWKVLLVKSLLPHFSSQGYGRILFSESSSVKQPVENLVLSNSLRMAIVGFSKTLSLEYAGSGITSNVIAPGFHETEAINRLFAKKSEQSGMTPDQARTKSIQDIPVKMIGDPEKFATLACWLLSPLSAFVTGQVYCLDGGAIKSSL